MNGIKIDYSLLIYVIIIGIIILISGFIIKKILMAIGIFSIPFRKQQCIGLKKKFLFPTPLLHVSLCSKP